MFCELKPYQQVKQFGLQVKVVALRVRALSFDSTVVVRMTLTDSVSASIAYQYMLDYLFEQY